MRIHDLPGHKPSEEWLTKADLEIYSAQPEKEGYYLKHGNKGIIFWGIDGRTIVNYLRENYAGFRCWTYCDFDAGIYGRLLGSQKEPIVITWHERQEWETI